MRTKRIFWAILLFSISLIFPLACKQESPASTDDDRQISQLEVRRGKHGINNGRGAGLGRKRQGRGWPESSVSLSEKEKEVIEIQTVKVSRQPFKPFLQAAGKVLAPYSKMSLISYAFPARVVRIHGQVGDWVDKNAPLITLQSEEVGRAKADFFKARADYELAQRNLARQKRLFERGAGAQKELLIAEAEFKVAEASFNATEKKLHVLGFSEEEIKLIAETHQVNPIITLYSPIRGKIVEVKVVPGEMVDQTKEIMTILDPSLLWVDAEIFERDISKVRIGQEVEVMVQAYPEKLFSGKVTYVGDVLKEETRTVTVRTEVANQGLWLKPGMFASIKIYLHEEKPVLMVPEAAVLDDQGEKFVFVRQGDVFQPKKLVLGPKQDGFFEVLSGLNEGEEVVTQGSYTLKSKLLQDVLKKAGLY